MRNLRVSVYGDHDMEAGAQLVLCWVPRPDDSQHEVYTRALFCPKLRVDVPGAGPQRVFYDLELLAPFPTYGGKASVEVLDPIRGCRFTVARDSDRTLVDDVTYYWRGEDFDLTRAIIVGRVSE